MAPIGMTTLPSGILFAEAIATDPIGWLGAEHVARFGADEMLLVKLLDPGQRLPVHAHPSGAFAAEHLGAAHGKAEAWSILRAGTVHLGLRESVDAARLLAIVDAQDTHALLGLLHAIRVDPGDSVYVPPGTLHAVGGGVLLAEVQEPEDLSILLEWSGFDLDGQADGHLGLGFELALQAVTTAAHDEQAVNALIRRGVAEGPTLVAASADYFRLDRVAGPATLGAGLAIVIGVGGTVTLHTAGHALDIGAGMTVLVPAGAGVQRYETSDGSALVARPPLA